MVSHGTHTWTVADPTPNTGEGNALTIRELLDRQPLTWSAVVDAAVETGIAPEGEAQTADKLARYLDQPVGSLGYALVPEPWINRNVPLREKVARILKGSQE